MISNMPQHHTERKDITLPENFQESLLAAHFHQGHKVLIPHVEATTSLHLWQALSMDPACNGFLDQREKEVSWSVLGFTGLVSDHS